MSLFYFTQTHRQINHVVLTENENAFYNEQYYTQNTRVVNVNVS